MWTDENWKCYKDYRLKSIDITENEYKVEIIKMSFNKSDKEWTMKDSVGNEKLSLGCDGFFKDGYEAVPIKLARF